MTNQDVPPDRMRRMKVLMLLAVGASLPVLANLVLHAWMHLVLAEPGAALSWRDYARVLSPIALAIFTIVLCIRGLRRSSLPGFPAVVGLTALVVAVALLNR